MDAGAGATAIRVPYHHLRDAEMELVSLNGDASGGDAGPPPPPHKDADPDPLGPHQPRSRDATDRTKLVLACMVAAGVQFGWALQLSLLTPYIQTLGIDHAMASFIWLCGPITGFVVSHPGENKAPPTVRAHALRGGEEEATVPVCRGAAPPIARAHTLRGGEEEATVPGELGLNDGEIHVTVGDIAQSADLTSSHNVQPSVA